MSPGQNPPSQDLATLLEEDTGLALTFAQNLFRGELPPKPDRCISMKDSGGSAPDPHLVYQRPTVQCIVRGGRGNYDDPHRWAQDIENSLNGRHGEVVDGSRYIGIWVLSPVSWLELDESQRNVFSINFRIHRTTVE